MREFASIGKRHRAKGEAETYRAASIICSIYNVNRGKGQDPITPDDLMAKSKRQQTPDQMLNVAKSLTSIFGKKPEG